MRLDEVHQGIQKFKPRRRIGRGPGSGHGKTAGKGHKGQTSRHGWSQHPTFQGGAMPMVRRIPKRGFTNSFAPVVAIVNVGDLENLFEAGAEVTLEAMREKNLAKQRYDLLKVLGNGTLTKKLKISAHRFSKSALEKIQAAGGEAVIVPGKMPVEQKKKQKRPAKK